MASSNVPANLPLAKALNETTRRFDHFSSDKSYAAKQTRMIEGLQETTNVLQLIEHKLHKAGNGQKVNTTVVALRSKIQLISSVPHTAFETNDLSKMVHQGANVGDLTVAIMKDVCDIAEGIAINAGMQDRVNKLRDAMHTLSQGELAVGNEARSLFSSYDSSQQFNTTDKQYNNTGNGKQMFGNIVGGYNHVG